MSLTFSNATIVAPKPITDATDRSNSPAVNDTISPSVMTSWTAWVPKIVSKLAEVKNVCGRRSEKTMMTTAHRTRIP